MIKEDYHISDKEYDIIEKIVNTGVIFPSTKFQDIIDRHEYHSNTHLVTAVVYNNIIRDNDYNSEYKDILLHMVKTTTNRIYTAGILFPVDLVNYYVMSFLLERRKRIKDGK